MVQADISRFHCYLSIIYLLSLLYQDTLIDALQTNNNVTVLHSVFKMSYIPNYYVPIAYSRNSKKILVPDDELKFYAIKWPQDSIEDVVNRVSRNGTSPFQNESVTIYPDQILNDLRLKEKSIHDINNNMTNESKVEEEMDSVSNNNGLEKRFWDYYNPLSTLNFDTQMTLAAAIHMFRIPKVLIFGSGLDSPLICKAVSDIHPHSNVYFLENDFRWTYGLKKKLSRISSRCEIIPIWYDTALEDWIDLIGMENELAENVMSQLPTKVQNSKFDVILVDSPVGNDFGQPGRMASIATADRLIRTDGQGIIFVDDIHRFVEMLFSSYLLRPKFGKEHVVRGWGNTWRTVYFTQNKPFLDYFG